MLNISLRSAHPTPVRNYVAQPIPPLSANEILHRRRKPSSTRFPFGNTPNRDNPRCPAHYAPLGQKNPVQTGQMRKKGVEPIHPNREQEPESCASTNFATFAHKSSAKPPQRQTAAATLYTHARRLMQVFFASPRFLPLFCRTLCRYRSIRARGAPYRQSRYGTPAATLLPASGQYAPLSPYCLRQYGLWGALYVAIAPYELWGRPKPLLSSSKTATSAMNGHCKARL